MTLSHNTRTALIAVIAACGVLGAYHLLWGNRDHASRVITQVVEESEPAVVSVVALRKDREWSGGTAFFVSADGLLLTNRHVVQSDRDDYEVVLADDTRLRATVVDRDPSNDIALLRVRGEDYPFLPLAQSNHVRLGETVIAIGNALAEFRNTVSVGVLAGMERSIEVGGRKNREFLPLLLQTDAAVNLGNSGGPLLNTRGEVIGMNTASDTKAQSIAFAIPAAELRVVLDAYRSFGRIVRPFIGISYIEIDEHAQKKHKIAYDYGLLIAGEGKRDAIAADSPAARAGLRSGDIILAADGRDLRGAGALEQIFWDKKPGDTLTLHVDRKGKQLEIVVTLAERPAQGGGADGETGKKRPGAGD